MSAESDELGSSQFQEALILIEAEQPFKALPLLEQVIEAHPDFAKAYAVRAKLRRRLNDWEGAIADYSKAIKLSPAVGLYLARALVWLKLDKAEGVVSDARRAIAMIEMIELLQGKPATELAGAHRLLGKGLSLLKDGVGAATAYKQAARYYIDAKDKENAALCLDRIEALKSLPSLPATKQQAIAHYGSTALTNAASPADFLALLWQKYEQKQYSGVLKDADWLLQCELKNVEAMCLRGLAYAQLGKAQQAVEDFAIAAKLSPSDTAVRFHRARMRLALSDGAGAVEDLSILIETVGAESKFFAQRAAAYRAIGESDKAFKDYANALAIETENAELYQRRAEVQQSMGENAGAIEDYQKAATLWLNEGKWAEHQQVVGLVRELRSQTTTTSSRTAGSSVQIKAYKNHLPVVEVLCDGIATFDLVIDRNAAHSIVTKRMAQQLNLELVSYRYVYLADGAPMELPIARLRSVAIGSMAIADVYVAVAPDKEIALLGKDCFGSLSVRISANEITFTR